MTWEAVGAIGEVIGGIAVLVTLIYLARQVSSAERLMRAESRNRRLNDARDLNRYMMEHPDIAEALDEVGNTLDDNLDPRQYRIWMNYTSAFFLQLQADYELHLDGVFSAEDLDKFFYGRLESGVRLRPRTVIAWQRTRDSYPEEFARVIDAALEKIQDQ